MIGGQDMSEVKDEKMIMKLKKPYTFEGKEYTEIDLSKLEEATISDMVEVNRIMDRKGDNSEVRETTLLCAILLASRATSLPIEFFEGLPIKEAAQLRIRVMNFLLK